jgi:hypothetical protein
VHVTTLQLLPASGCRFRFRHRPRKIRYQ